MLFVEHVTKKYGKLTASDDITFRVENGQIAVLLGPNGAGKSTIIKCIAGLLRFQGKIEIDGAGNKTLEAKRLLGYIPEMPAIYELLTVGEHLEFIRHAYRLEDDGYGDALLERLELADKKDKLGKELSKGMQQKLSICCGLLPRPRVAVFDEPLVGLDPHAIKQLIDPLPELRRYAGKVFSVHGKDTTVDWTGIREQGISCGLDFTPDRFPGFGVSNWRDVCYFLHRAGYEGDVSIEGYHDNCYRGEWEMTGQLHALHYLKWARGGEFVPTPWEA